MSFEETTELARAVVEVFEDFLDERGIDIPNPDKAQSEGPCVIYGEDYGELVDRITCVISGKSMRQEPPVTKATPPATGKIEASCAATIPLAVRLVDELATASALRKPTSWQICATGKGENEGKKCRVRLLAFRNAYEVQVDNEIGFASSYHRECEGKTIADVHRTLMQIQRDVENGIGMPF